MCKFCEIDKMDACRPVAYGNTDVKFNDEVVDRHVVGIYIIRYDDDRYVLNVDSYYQKSDITLGEAEVEIQYCPFCGEKLQ